VGGEPVDAVASLVRGTEYPALVIEVDAAPSLALESGVLQDVVQELDGLIDKPGGIEAVIDGTLDSVGSDHAWTKAELSELGEDSFDLSVGTGTIKLHVMLIDGHSEQDEGDNSIVGLAWENTHIALFMERIEAVCTTARCPGPMHDELLPAGQYAILLHELGHLLGLVNLGLPMVEGHEDADHEGHCDNPDCVMYHAFERQRALERLHERFIAGDMAYSSLDDACLADVASVRDAP
jgi:hypothetical protein